MDYLWVGVSNYTTSGKFTYNSVVLIFKFIYPWLLIEDANFACNLPLKSFYSVVGRGKINVIIQPEGKGANENAFT